MAQEDMVGESLAWRKRDDVKTIAREPGLDRKTVQRRQAHGALRMRRTTGGSSMVAITPRAATIVQFGQAS
jgi:hypothetical protein